MTRSIRFLRPARAWLLAALFGAAWCALSSAAEDKPAETKAAESAEPKLVETPIFVSGEGGYHTYRIPSLICARNGDLLAFCEGRKSSQSDTGDIDLVMRRSDDGGKTWSNLQVVWDDAGNTCGNPCPVVDLESGVITLLLTWNAGNSKEHGLAAGLGKDSRLAFVSYSTDDGKTWTKPEDISAKVKDPKWTWYATGPGAGIELQRGKHAGRYVVPCDHKERVDKKELAYSHVIYSDDRGATWKLGGRTPADKCNECEVVELTDGRLLLNMRNHDSKLRARQISYSDDGGATWSKPVSDQALIEPVCQASIRRISWPASGAAGKSAAKHGVIAFSNPANVKSRSQLTIRASYDDGKTWPVARELYSGGSAYSCLALQPNGLIACLYERDGYKKISLAQFPLSWVEAGKQATK